VFGVESDYAKGAANGRRELERGKEETEVF